MKKQTALNWLLERVILTEWNSDKGITTAHLVLDYNDLDIAREMEKEQMEELAINMVNGASIAAINFTRDQFEKYYSQTYSG
jgi:hypothetical protein